MPIAGRYGKTSKGSDGDSLWTLPVAISKDASEIAEKLSAGDYSIQLDGDTHCTNVIQNVL